MISITYTNDGTNAALTIKGHSGFAGNGHDIVCAAVTALAYTLAQYVNMHGGSESSAKLSDGRAEILLHGCENRAVFDAVIEGLKLIADGYPQNVELIKI